MPPFYCTKRNKYKPKQDIPPLHHHQQRPTGHKGPLRRGNGVRSCVCRCECLCMCVCVFVWHGWPEECSGSRLAEPSQKAGSFTLQGNSTLIRSKRERDRDGEASVGQCLKNYTRLSNCCLFSFAVKLHQLVCLFFVVFTLSVNL